MTGIDVFDLTGGGGNQLKLTAQNVADFSDNHALFVKGKPGDSVSSTGQGWIAGVDETVGGLLYHTFTDPNTHATLHVQHGVDTLLS